jgi:oxygen-dependent protoporphyrinogen oxidase
MNYTVTIVGGGISGLTVAYRLLTLKKQNNLPVDITLIESSDRLGGVIKSELNDNFVVEHGPDAFLSEKPEIRNLLTELELTTELVPT